MRGEDRLSNLPENLLHHIFSFIDTKELIRTTCLLSKKWTDFWVSVPYIRLYITSFIEDPRRCYCSRNFIDQVLGRYRLSNSTIQSFLLQWYYCVPHLLNAWITTALSLQVQELDLFLCLRETDRMTFELPTELFTSSSSIRVFKLGTSFPNSTMQIPLSMLSATHLGTLELVEVTLPRRTEKGELALRCPALEVLVINNCDHKHLKVLNVSANQLKKLVIDNSATKRGGFRDSLVDCRLELHCPKLSSFVYKGSMYVDSLIGNLTALMNADISFETGSSLYSLEGWERACQKGQRLMEVPYAIKVLRGLCNVRTLALEGIQIFPEVPDTLGEVLASYNNLKKLELKTYIDINASVTRLASLLGNCSSIETLVLQVVQCLRKVKEKPMLPLPHPLNHLTYVAVKRLQGLDSEFEFLRFLLNSAVNLEKMVITGYAMRNLKLKRRALMKFRDKLVALSQDFPNVEISFQIL